MIVLNARNLAKVSSRVSTPSYSRASLRVGIVHFGVGGFHRAHQAMYVDQLLELGGSTDWAICGVGLLAGDAHMAKVLEEQDCLYALVTKGADGTSETRVIGSLIRYLYGPDSPQAVLDQLDDPTVRIVSLTITEGGYHLNQVSGELDASAPELQHDLAWPGRPTSAFGYIVEALRHRRDSGILPFTVVSCDNVQGNGDMARAMIVSFASLQDPELARWISDTVAFPNSMVDRITPVTTEKDRIELAETSGIEDNWPVVAESFSQWVLEDAFTAGRPPLELVGVQTVGDVEPYELMKLRLLNASHQALCYLGYLAGYRFVHEVCRDPLFTAFLMRYMDQEATPTLRPVPGIDLGRYKRQLIERFANANIRDTLSRLCAESSDRVPKWLLPVVEGNLSAGRPVECAALVVASWARYAEGTDEQGKAIEVVDRLSERLVASAQEQEEDEVAFLRNSDLFGDLIDNGRFVGAYRRSLVGLRRNGSRATLAAFMRA